MGNNYNMATFDCFAVCTLAIAGDFEYIYFRPNVNQTVD